MDGVFEGVTGVIRRVKRCKRVVVEIEGMLPKLMKMVEGETF